MECVGAQCGGPREWPIDRWVLACACMWTVLLGGLLGLLAACGSVRDTGPDAGGADMWASSYAPPALITTVDGADSKFGNTCVHGQWYLQAFNGSTMRQASGLPDSTATVAPVAITIGSNPLDPSSTFAVHVTGSGQMNGGGAFSFAQLTASPTTARSSSSPRPRTRASRAT